jgi:hypothetical protein
LAGLRRPTRFLLRGGSDKVIEAGGLLVSLPREQAVAALQEIELLGLSCGLVGRVTQRDDKKFIVR